MNQEMKVAPSNQEQTVVLAQDLSNLAGWGFNNAAANAFGMIFPGLGCLTGIVVTIINPLWIVPSIIFGSTGTAKLKKGDLAGAERAIACARLTNWILVLIGIVVWSLWIKSYQSRGMAYHMLHQPKVEIVQSEPDHERSRPRPAVASVRAEMRQALTGGHVLQVWNTTTEPITCTATLENPELEKSPTHTFTLEPGAEKPKELGIKQFGHRIKRFPRCSVTIKVHGTGEVYKYTP